MSRDEETAQLRAELHRLHAQARRDREALDWATEQNRVLRRLVIRLSAELNHLRDSGAADEA